MPGISELYASAANRYIQSCINRGKADSITRATVDKLVMKALDSSHLDLDYKLCWYAAILYTDHFENLWIGIKQLHSLSDEAVRSYQPDLTLYEYTVPSDYSFSDESEDELATVPKGRKPPTVRKLQVSRLRKPRAPPKPKSSSRRVSFRAEPAGPSTGPSSAIPRSSIVKAPKRSILKKFPGTKPMVSKAPRKPPMSRETPGVKEKGKGIAVDSDAGDREVLAYRVTDTDAMALAGDEGDGDSEMIVEEGNSFMSMDGTEDLDGDEDEDDEMGMDVGRRGSEGSSAATFNNAGFRKAEDLIGIRETAPSEGTPTSSTTPRIAEVTGTVEITGTGDDAGMAEEQIDLFNKKLDSLFEED